MVILIHCYCLGNTTGTLNGGKHCASPAELVMVAVVVVGRESFGPCAYGAFLHLIALTKLSGMAEDSDYVYAAGYD